MSRPKEEAYMPNVRAAQKLREQQRAWEQWRWHTGQARRHKTVSALIVAHHEQEARRIAELWGFEDDGPEAA